MAKSRHTAITGTNWEWVDESKEVIESVKAPHDLSSFNFVAENGVSRPRGEKPRKLIRAHATRHGRANNALTTKSANQAKNSSPMNRFPRCITLDPFKTLPGGETHETSLLLDYYTQFKEFEPFKPLPGSPTPATNPVLSNWIAVQSDSDLAVGATTTWLSFAKAEPALFHVTLLIAGIRMASDVKSPAVQVALLYQRGEAIRGVSEYLQKHKDSKDQHVNWTIVCTVAALAQADSALSLRSSALEHLNGLELLVRARGGLKVFENFWNGRARSYIEWIDLNASLLMDTPPRFSTSRTSSTGAADVKTSQHLPSHTAD